MVKLPWKTLPQGVPVPLEDEALAVLDELDAVLLLPTVPLDAEDEAVAVPDELDEAPPVPGPLDVEDEAVVLPDELDEAPPALLADVVLPPPDPSPDEE